MLPSRSEFVIKTGNKHSKITVSAKRGRKADKKKSGGNK